MTCPTREIPKKSNRDVRKEGFTVPRLEDLRDLQEFCRVLDKTQAEIVFLDNLMLSLSGADAGNVYRMGGILGRTIDLCCQFGATPVFVHHFKRTRTTADPYAPGELLDLSQAGAAETAGQWWLLTRREEYDPDQPGEHKLWLSIGGRVGNSSLHALNICEGSPDDPGGRVWRPEVLPASEARAREQEVRNGAKALIEKQAHDDRCRQVWDWLCSEPDGATRSRIRDEAGVNGRYMKPVLDSLLESGSIEEVKLTVGNGRSCDGFRVVRAPEDANDQQGNLFA